MVCYHLIGKVKATQNINEQGGIQGPLPRRSRVEQLKLNRKKGSGKKVNSSKVKKLFSSISKVKDYESLIFFIDQ